jgi:hypothetical protein
MHARVGSLIERDRDGAVLLAGVLRVPKELERAVAAALGPADARRRSGHEHGDARRQWLRENAAGSATLVPRRRSVVPP